MQHVTSQSNRYREIDLFRGVAIIMVMGFHYFSRWTPPRFEVNLYPYGGYFSENILSSYGHLGVEFFFIISGFVIALTLERCRTPGDFLKRRLARLLPAMIVCSLLTIVIVNLFVPVAELQKGATLWNLLPSWTFTDPYLWQKFLPVTGHVDGAYWSLVVEAKFYFWAAVIFFLNRNRFVFNMLIFCTLTTCLHIVGEAYSFIWLQRLDHLFFGRYAMLFAAGILFYQIHARPADVTKYLPFLFACLALELVRLTHLSYPWGVVIWNAAFEISFFLAFLAVSLGYKAPEGPIADALVRLGIVSYPLYLLHQNIGVGLLNLADGNESPLVIFVIFAGICAVLVWASHFLYTTVEQPGKTLVLKLKLARPIEWFRRTV